MSSDEPLVEISPLMPDDHHRHVRIAMTDATPIWVPCANQQDLVEAVHEYRPDINPDDRHQVRWIDHPGEWPAS
ncbi:hypothetical protein [Kitasatospora sp. NPDC001175]|uniref:hypothetical protein n=1 Tax=Kitasatospora sp. NPDC001175 TaxID=3157103 RepID=UPI003CFFCFAA